MRNLATLNAMGTLFKVRPKLLSRRSFVASGARLAVGLPASASVLAATAAFGADQASSPEVQIDDADGILGRTQAPVRADVKLSARFRRAAAEARLVLREVTPKADSGVNIPVHTITTPLGDEVRLSFLMPSGPASRRRFALHLAEKQAPRMLIREVNRQFEIADESQPVLRYNFTTIEPGEAIKSVSAENLKYAAARSDYIHPLYGPQGEVMTKDWSADHPHHRGIYWAWPEVDWRGQRGDLHALQKVFARPAGRCESVSGAVFAELRAENVWKWEDREPIVREQVRICAYAVSERGRAVDLELGFEALGDPVLLARRGTSQYGGLNIRLSAIQDQRIIKHTDPGVTKPRAAWSDLSGLFGTRGTPAGLTVIQHSANPDYPGDWVDYPELNWVQPTFPAGGTRYRLEGNRPLKLRFRLWIHSGNQFTDEMALDLWKAAHSQASPLS